MTEDKQGKEDLRRSWYAPDKEFLKRFEHTVKERSMNMSQATVEANTLWMDGRRKGDKASSETMSERQLKYDGHCKICGKELPAGSWALWSPGVTICIDCEVHKYGDKSQLRRLMKNKELDWDNSLLDKAIDEKVAKLRNLNMTDVMNRIDIKSTETQNKVSALVTSLYDYLKQGSSKDGAEQKTLEEVVKATAELVSSTQVEMALVDEARDTLSHPFRKRKKPLLEIEEASHE
jgi:hypothetical protein